jgi:hypothetical protein
MSGLPGMGPIGPNMGYMGIARAIMDLIARVDCDIAAWIAAPMEELRSLVDSETGQDLTDSPETGNKVRDMLMIRLHCAEEFQKVARVHEELLRLRYADPLSRMDR